MKEIEIPGHITSDGKLELVSRDWLKQKLIDNAGNSVDVIIRPRSNNISHNQRKYFFGVIADMLLEYFNDHGTRCDLGQVVDFIKEKWLYREEFNPITNRVIKSHISLSDSSKGLSREEFTDKKEEVQQWAIENIGLDIPDPDPEYKTLPETHYYVIVDDEVVDHCYKSEKEAKAEKYPGAIFDRIRQGDCSVCRDSIKNKYETEILALGGFKK